MKKIRRKFTNIKLGMSVMLLFCIVSARLQAQIITAVAGTHGVYGYSGDGCRQLRPYIMQPRLYA